MSEMKSDRLAVERDREGNCRRETAIAVVFMVNPSQRGRSAMSIAAVHAPAGVFSRIDVA